MRDAARVLAVVVVALVAAAAAAAADVPAGFTPEPQLAAKAELVAGKPVEVLCTLSDAAWAAEEAARPGENGAEVLARAEIAGSVIYMSPTACAPLLWRRPKRDEDLLDEQGAAIEVLAHEAEHTAGVADEGETECAALAAMPSFAWRFVPARLVSGPHRTRVQRRRLAHANAQARARMHRLLLEGARLRHAAAVEASPAYAGPCDAP